MPALVSVIICTHNRADLLEGALRSVLLDDSKVAREIIVVDNASTDRTADVVGAARTASPVLPLHYLFEPRPGLSYARNAGIDNAAGDLLLFTDDDVLVEPGWADAIAAAFDDPRVGAVGGRVLPIWPTPPPEWLRPPHAEAITLRDFGTQRRTLGGDPSSLPVGANMAVRKRVALERHPPFDPRVGTFPGLKIDGDDTIFMLWVAEHHVLAYEPTAVVRHRVEPERMDRDWLRRCYYQKGFGRARWERRDENLPGTLFNRLRKALRSCRVALGQKRQNRFPAAVDADSARLELYAYSRAGRDLDNLLHPWPKLVERAARWRV